MGLEGQDMLLRTTPAEQARRVPVDRLEALWVRKRATRKGAKIGAITGGVLGVGFGIIIGEVLCNDEDCEADTVKAALGLGALGAIAGAIPGALIGYLVQSKRRGLRSEVLASRSDKPDLKNSPSNGSSP